MLGLDNNSHKYQTWNNLLFGGQKYFMYSTTKARGEKADKAKT